MDDSYEQLNGRTTNILSLAESVQKKDAGAIYTCQAVNNNQSIPVATKLKLEISCKYFWNLDITFEWVFGNTKYIFRSWIFENDGKKNRCVLR